MLAEPSRCASQVKMASPCSRPHARGGIPVNYFVEELKKIIGPTHPDTIYAGRACFVKLGPANRAKVEFTTQGHADHYEALRVTVLNREDGPVDTLTLRFADILGKKQVSNPNFRDGIHPHIWMDRGTAGWYVYQPTQEDYRTLGAELSAYLGVFLEGPTQTEESGQCLC